MGQLLVRAIFSRDYMVVQGVAMVFACATVLVNFLADILTVAARSEGEAVSDRGRCSSRSPADGSRFGRRGDAWPRGACLLGALRHRWRFARR